MLLLLLFSIVIESLLFPVLSICVLFDWSVSLSKKKKVGTVGCTLRLALSKQIKINFFCDNNIILTPPPPLPPPLHTEIVTIPKNLPTLAGANLGCSGDSIFNFPPLPNCQQPQ